MIKFQRKNMKIFLLILICLFVSFEVDSKSTNVLKLSCEYDPNLIKKKQKDIGFLESEKIDRAEICSTFGCDDIIKVEKHHTQSDVEDEYRLRNSWFNHQGILLDDFLITANTITINTFVSQAYFLESYLINRVTGKTKRTFYRFDNPEFIYNINRLEKNTKRKPPLYDEKGKLSLKTLELFSLEPWEIISFEGKCQKGIRIKF